MTKHLILKHKRYNLISNEDRLVFKHYPNDSASISLISSLNDVTDDVTWALSGHKRFSTHSDQIEIENREGSLCSSHTPKSCYAQFDLPHSSSDLTGFSLILTSVNPQFDLLVYHSQKYDSEQSKHQIDTKKRTRETDHWYTGRHPEGHWGNERRTGTGRGCRGPTQGQCSFTVHWEGLLPVGLKKIDKVLKILDQFWPIWIFTKRVGATKTGAILSLIENGLLKMVGET